MLQEPRRNNNKNGKRNKENGKHYHALSGKMQPKNAKRFHALSGKK